MLTWLRHNETERHNFWIEKHGTIRPGLAGNKNYPERSEKHNTFNSNKEWKDTTVSVGKFNSEGFFNLALKGCKTIPSNQN